jgi:hypothetical protein
MDEMQVMRFARTTGAWISAILEVRLPMDVFNGLRGR